MLAIIIGFAGVGGLRFAPWLALLIPFAAIRIGFQREVNIRPALTVYSLRIANVIVDAAMIAVFVYLYNLAVLSYCPPPK